MLEFTDVRKSYTRGASVVHALGGVTLEIRDGEFAAIIGASGSGKSTLLQLAGALDTPDGGVVRVAGTDLSRADDEQRTKLRREVLGFVFQFFNLLPTMSALENVMFPGLLAGLPEAEARSRALALLAEMGLEGRAGHRPDELSGGQMQRCAVARALVTRPKLILADEPTGNLDSKTGAEILGLLRSLTTKHGTTIVMVTHDPKAAATADRVITLKDGLVERDERASPTQA